MWENHLPYQKSIKRLNLFVHYINILIFQNGEARRQV